MCRQFVFDDISIVLLSLYNWKGSLNECTADMPSMMIGITEFLKSSSKLVLNSLRAARKSQTNYANPVHLGCDVKCTWNLICCTVIKSVTICNIYICIWCLNYSRPLFLLHELTSAARVSLCQLNLILFNYIRERATNAATTTTTRTLRVIKNYLTRF